MIWNNAGERVPKPSHLLPVRIMGGSELIAYVKEDGWHRYFDGEPLTDVMQWAYING